MGMVDRENLVSDFILRPARVAGGVLLAAVFSHSAAPASAVVVASEPFAYGAASGALAGKNGGSGFSGAWAGNAAFTYNPTGLTLGTLQAQGGAASYASTESTIKIQRPFGAGALAGTVYGGYLFRVVSRSDPFNNASLFLGQANDGDAEASFDFKTPTNSSVSPAFAVIEDLNSGPSDNLVGAEPAPAVGTTYLALFKVNPAGTARWDAWILTAPQYNSFVAGGLAESVLNAAAIGTGPGNVWARGSASGAVAVDPMTHLGLFSFTPGDVTVTFDEIRISNTSLLEAAPAVPEPASLGLLAVGTLAFRRRRAR